MTRFLLGTLTLLACARIAGSCDCAAPSVKESLERSGAVFTGKCVSVAVMKGEALCTFEVDRVWKGKIGPTVTVRSDLHACGYAFSIKGYATYLVYAHDLKGGWTTNICTRTTTLANAKADLKELGDGAKPKEEKKTSE